MKFTMDLSKSCAKRCIRTIRNGKCYCMRRKRGSSWFKERVATATRH